MEGSNEFKEKWKSLIRKAGGKIQRSKQDAWTVVAETRKDDLNCRLTESRTISEQVSNSFF